MRGRERQGEGRRGNEEYNSGSLKDICEARGNLSGENDEEKRGWVERVKLEMRGGERVEDVTANECAEAKSTEVLFNFPT